MLIRNADRAGKRIDLRLAEGRIVEMATRLAPQPAEREFDAAGGAVLPGLHDHHLHLLSLAASLESVECGPPSVETEAALGRALQAQAQRDPDAWVRGTGYFESVAGALDRVVLDRLLPNQPLRIQHRSGVAWFLNTPALRALGVDTSPEDLPEGIERDASGQPTGRLFRLDDWLRERMPERPLPDLRRVGQQLAGYGVTGVTDATPTNGPEERALFARAQKSGVLPQRLILMGDQTLDDLGQAAQPADLRIGACKIMLDDVRLPALDALIEKIRVAHAAKRPVAIHTVTRGEVLFALAALESAGTQSGDRLEHASVTPEEAVQTVARLGLRIVTQPNFVRERGDAYLQNVDPIDQALLYRLRDWHEAKVELAGGTDAPFGHPDPWRAMRAAVDRRTAADKALGEHQALSPEEALRLFTSPGDHPGGPERLVEVGSPADLCLLDRPWASARDALEADQVRATVIGGRIAWMAAD